MLSTLQKKPRTAGIFKKTLFIFFFVFSTIFCKLNPFCKVPTSEYACRHAQIDLFTSRKWIRVGISTLQPLKVQGGQNSIFFSWFAKSKLEFSHRKRTFCKLQASYFHAKNQFWIWRRKYWWNWGFTSQNLSGDLNLNFRAKNEFLVFKILPKICQNMNFQSKMLLYSLNFRAKNV